MFGNLLCRIEKTLAWNFDDNDSWSVDFYQQIKTIHQDILTINKRNTVACQNFFQQKSELFRQLDEKIIRYEKNHEMMIAGLMSGQIQLNSEKKVAAQSSKTTFIELYRALFFAERQMLHEDPTHICHVGCGPMPASILMWMKYTNSAVTAIDFDSQAIASAQNVFECWRHAKGIPAGRAIFITSPGENFNYKDIDLILISASVINKKKVYAAILASAASGVTVIERTPNFLYDQVFTTPAEFEEYLVNSQTQENINLRAYRFRPRTGEAYGE